MAAIESLDGISRVNEFDYQVTKVVNIGANIDDLRDANFTIRDGGRMQFITGCTTTFTRCTFTELKSMKVVQSTSIPTNNTNARFQGTTAPIFKGCKFLMADEMRSNSFDAVSTAAPSFLYDEYKTPCYVFINNVYQNPQKQFWHWNTLASDKIVINGLIWDQKGPSGLAFDLPPSINNMTMVNNNPASTNRHVNFLTRNWSVNTTREIAGLIARNIATWGGDDTRTLVMVDCSTPGGDDIPRSGEAAGISANIIGKRTYKASPFDPAVGHPIQVRRYLKNSANENVVVDDKGYALNEKLFTHRFAAEQRVAEYANTYLRGFYRYGYEPALNSLTLVPIAAGKQYDDGSVLMLPDASITEPDKAVVDAYSITTDVTDSAVTITGGSITTRQAYDAICANIENNWQAVDLRVGRAGDMLDVGSRTLSLPSVDGDLQSSGTITVTEIAEGRVIKDSPNVTIGTLPVNLTLDNAILKIGPGADVTEYTELNGAGYKATANGEYIARGKSASIIDANGFTITVVTAALPTPSTMNFVADGARWAIYDNNNSFVESGSGNKVLAHTGGVDAGVWTIVSHKKGYAGQIDRWTSDDGSVTNLTFVGSQIRRSTGEVATTNDPFLDATTSVSAGRIHTLIANKAVGPQQIINAQQSFLNTDAGLNWIRQNQPSNYPTWATMNGISYLLTKEGFTYDSVVGITQEAAIAATLISAASHLSIIAANGGVTVSGGALTGEDIARAVWERRRTDHTTAGTMGEAQSVTQDMAQISAQNTQS